MPQAEIKKQEREGVRYFHALANRKTISRQKKEGQDYETLSFEAYASTSEKDRYGTVIAQKAVRDAMDAYMQNPVVLWGHDQDEPIGVVNDFSGDEKGTIVNIELRLNRNQVFESVERDIVKGLSIGFMIEDLEFIETEDDFYILITKIDLAEISLCSVPANRLSLIRSVNLAMSDEVNKSLDALRALKAERKAPLDKKDLSDAALSLKSKVLLSNNAKRMSETTQAETPAETTTQEVEKVVETPPANSDQSEQVTPPAETPKEPESTELSAEKAKVVELTAQVEKLKAEKAELQTKHTELESKYAELDKALAAMPATSRDQIVRKADPQKPAAQRTGLMKALS